MENTTKEEKGKLLYIIFTIIILIIIASYIILTSVPLGTQRYKSPNTGITLNVPKFSLFKEECCMFSANFISKRSTNSLKKEIEKELKNYDKITCKGKTYYYNKEQDFTITEYYVQKGFIFNKFNIVFDKGNYCGEVIEEKYQFIGKIIEVYQNGNLIVEPYEDEDIRRSSDKISVKSNADRIWEIGLDVIVTYTGEIMESYPAQINTIDVRIYIPGEK